MPSTTWSCRRPCRRRVSRASCSSTCCASAGTPSYRSPTSGTGKSACRSCSAGTCRAPTTCPMRGGIRPTSTSAASRISASSAMSPAPRWRNRWRSTFGGGRCASTRRGGPGTCSASRACSCSAVKVSPTGLLRRPALLGERDELGPILEVHGVEVVPLGTPDEAVALEDLADGGGDAVLPGDLAVLALRPFPVVAELVVDVDGGAEGVHRESVGIGDGAAVVDAGRRHQIARHVGGQLIELLDHLGQARVDAVHRGRAHRAAVPGGHPGHRRKPPCDLALAAIAVHLEEKLFVADATGILVHGRDLELGAERIGNGELILDVGLVEQLIECLAAAPIGDRHAHPVLP